MCDIAASKMELFVTKIGNGCKLLLAVVTENFVLNVTRLQNPTMVQIKTIKYSNRHLEVQSQQKKQKKHWNNMSNMFEVNNKYTRTTTGVSIVNLEHIFQCILLLLLLNSNKYCKTLVSDKVGFNNCEKHIVLLAGKIFVELHVFILFRSIVKNKPLICFKIMLPYFLTLFCHLFLTILFNINK